MITIDYEKCVKDFKCVDECPVRLFSFSKDEGKIIVSDDADKTCIKCGHCAAVCPEGAVNLSFMDESMFMESEELDLLLNEKNMEMILRSRRSVRSYKNKPVDKNNLEKLLALGSAAPTGHNSRSVNWLVIYDKEKIDKMKGMVIDWMKFVDEKDPATSELLDFKNVIAGYEAGYDGILRGAPHLIIAYASKFAPTAAIDCATALGYLEVAAPAFGLGTCWAGFFNIAASMWKPLKEELSLPDGHKQFGTIMVGHPKHKYKKIIKRESGKIIFA